MKTTAVARRYAMAGYLLAQEEGILDQMEEELKSVVELVEAEPDLKQVLGHQRITINAKKELVKKLFEGRLADTTICFLQLVIDKRRERYLGSIYREFVNYANKARNILVAQVKSAVELSPVQLQHLEDKLSMLTRKKVRLEVTIEDSLLGGVQVKMGDRVIDGTLVKRLELLKTKLQQTPIEEMGRGVLD